MEIYRTHTRAHTLTHQTHRNMCTTNNLHTNVVNPNPTSQHFHFKPITEGIFHFLLDLYSLRGTSKQVIAAITYQWQLINAVMQPSWWIHPWGTHTQINSQSGEHLCGVLHVYPKYHRLITLAFHTVLPSFISSVASTSSPNRYQLLFELRPLTPWRVDSRLPLAFTLFSCRFASVHFHSASVSSLLPHTLKSAAVIPSHTYGACIPGVLNKCKFLWRR